VGEGYCAAGVFVKHFYEAKMQNKYLKETIRGDTLRKILFILEFFVFAKVKGKVSKEKCAMQEIDRLRIKPLSLTTFASSPTRRAFFLVKHIYR